MHDSIVYYELWIINYASPNKDTNKDIKITKKYQIEILDLKSIRTKLWKKKNLEDLNSTFEQIRPEESPNFKIGQSDYPV